MLYTISVLFLVTIAGANAQLRYFTNLQEFQSSLQPVQGLYVQPSSDGETGDLFVAASEDDGVQTPWVADTAVKMVQEGQDTAEKEQINKGNVAAVMGQPSAAVANQETAVAMAEPTFVNQPQVQIIPLSPLGPSSFLDGSSIGSNVGKSNFLLPQELFPLMSSFDSMWDDRPRGFIPIIIVDASSLLQGQQAVNANAVVKE